ncbi:MAG: hypothetical protein ACP5JJ_00165, partial [Anaerolineae bacterium]
MKSRRRSAGTTHPTSRAHGQQPSVLRARQIVSGLLALAMGLLVGACDCPNRQPMEPAEVPVTAIPLAGAVAVPAAEVSGMAWYGDYLVLLPQYPGRFRGGEDGALFALPRGDILAFLDGGREAPLEPIPIPLLAPDLAEDIQGFEGYEAIAFRDDCAYLTIEASSGTEMRGYLVSGRISPDLSSLSIDPASRVEIPLQADLQNHSDEAILVASNGLLTFYEGNGQTVNPNPVAHRFGMDLTPAGTLPFPHIEYRITDVTALDSEGRFWAINYFFPGDEKLQVVDEPLAARYGRGPSHARYEQVERLLEFQYEPSGIQLVDRPPLQIELPSEEARNWEGIARLEGRGFLLMTDKFPGTILA